jgi:hypothetical protein
LDGCFPASGFRPPASERGVALVITLILLSVTLVMAVAFLAISGRDRGSVTTQTDTATTRLAADSALAAAEAQIAANALSATNPYAFGLLVSTNYIPLPVVPADPLGDFTNQQYSPRVPVWLTNLVTGALENRFYLDLNRNGADDPNGWVANMDNTGHTNGTYSFEVGDPEWIGVLERPDLPYGPNNPYIARYAFIALPVGNSLDLNAIHNQTLLVPFNHSVNPMSFVDDYYARNQGVGSWELNLAAFLADLNKNEWNQYQYLQASRDTLGNLIWGHTADSGNAFNDAFALLAHRYAYNYYTLLPVGGPAPSLFTTASPFFPFTNDIDAYSDGPLQTTPAGINEFNQNVTWPWAGADNTNHYFTPGELFDPTKTFSFSTNLLNAGTNFFGGSTVATYDRYTFYRMLSQLGTDSAPESGKMNLNYDNLVQYNLNSGAVSETNFFAWQPLVFFTNAADRMLKAYTTQWFQSNPSNFLQTYYGIVGNSANYYHQDSLGNTITDDPSGIGLTNVPFFGMTNQIPDFGVTSIPVLVNTNFSYTPAVQRVLQLAANIYDATTNSYYPDVFRPLFSTTNIGGYINVFITGYTNIEPIQGPDPSVDSQLSWPVDVSALAAIPFLPHSMPTNVYGVPWIVGAKKGFPNFNAFTMENIFGITRKLQLTRQSTSDTFLSNPDHYTTSQQLSLGITNMFGVECWNSYRPDYTNLVTIYATVTNTVVLTNDAGLNYPIPNSGPIAGAITINDWPGYGTGTIPPTTSFVIPLAQSETVLPPSNYTFPAIPTPANSFVPSSVTNFVANNLMLHWGMLVTNRVRVVMMESNSADGLYHVIDYAQLVGPDSSHDLTGDLTNQYDTATQSGNGFNGYNNQWDPTVNNPIMPKVPNGIANQFAVSAQLDPIILTPYWKNTTSDMVTNQIAGFRAFLGYGRLPGLPPSVGQYIAIGKTSLAQQAPYTPSAVLVYQTQWQVNDPLVHYLASDLTDFNQSTGPFKQIIPFTSWSFGQLNGRYMPWGGNPNLPTDTSFNSVNAYNLKIKDPLATNSDSWYFPTGKLPTAGWLGRVHRGTPWQTVYLKSSDVLANGGIGTWTQLTGNPDNFDATNSSPAQDRLLFDLFTTAFNDNATRGTLSINQSADQYDPDGNPADINPAAGLAAWSALFSGIALPPVNSTNVSTVIAPVGGLAIGNSPLGTLVTNINFARYNFKSADGLVGAFEHKGDILSVPQLTEQSPFLDTAQTNYNTDAMYEWLPQQTMSLLRVGTPRYVIYSYGQALKPAQGGVYLGAGPFFGMATNYQVVSEFATRAVIRLDTVRTNTSGAVTLTPPRAVVEQFNILPPD